MSQSAAALTFVHYIPAPSLITAAPPKLSFWDPLNPYPLPHAPSPSGAIRQVGGASFLAYVS